MRIALSSDVHGNAVAFDAFLTDLDRQSVDHVVCLGDHAQGGAQPAEVLEQLCERNWPAVMGNSDHFLLTLDFGHEEVTPQQIENAKWSKSQLSDDLLAFHEGFQRTIALDLGEGRPLLAFHATPRSWEEIVDPWMEEEKFRAPFEGLHAAVFAGGHTHQQWARRMGDAYYVNPGSVGLAYDHHQSASPWRADACAEYAILSVDGAGVGIEFRRIPFDVADLLDSIEASGMPHPDLAARPWR